MFGFGFLPLDQSFTLGFDVLLLVILLASFIFQAITKAEIRSPIRRVHQVQLVCTVYNGLLGFAGFSLGALMLHKLYSNTKSLTPLSSWFPPLVHGLVWMLITLSVSSRRSLRPLFLSKTMPVLAILSSAISSSFSVVTLVKDEVVSSCIVFEALSLPGAFLFFVCIKQQLKREEVDDKQLYTPLKNDAKSEGETGACLTSFSNAGIFSALSFGWLNPLMKTGAKKPLSNEDIPKLRQQERAESCYNEFMEHFNNMKGDPNAYMRALLHCHRRELVVSGFFALTKILTLAAGPLLLNTFILIAEGKSSHRYEGYLVAAFFFLCKIIESVSQRQWCFRTRLIGLKVRSLLMATVYKKQMNLCSAARSGHSSSEIMNYVTVDAYRVGEFPYWLHQTWTTVLQLCLSLLIVFNAVGIATFAALITIMLMVALNAPLAKLQNKFQQRVMAAQDERLKACTEALTSMKVLKLYAWETHFKEEIESLRRAEVNRLSAVQYRKAISSFVFWSTPVLVSASTFTACYFLEIPLNASNAFTFIATLRLVQEPIRILPEVIVAAIQARVSFSRIVAFLNTTPFSRGGTVSESGVAIRIKSGRFNWEKDAAKATLRDINLKVKFGEKIAVCGEVGSGKSSLLDAVLGELPNEQGTVEVNGTIAYVSQTAWIQTGTIRDNILFGSAMDEQRYNHTVKSCALEKDLQLFPFGDQTEIGEKGVNLSGGQKQRIQLARALYRDADIYLLDDPFSAVDAETATTLFNEYVMSALANKTVILVTHQVDFLPAFNSVLLMIDGEIRHAAPYNEVLSSSREFQLLVGAHKETAGSRGLAQVSFTKPQSSSSLEISKVASEKSGGRDNLIKKEEREIGDNGLKPYMQYLGQNRGYIYFSIVVFAHIVFVVGQILQNAWMARSVDDPNVTVLKLIVVYLLVGLISALFLLLRSTATVVLGVETSKSLFSQLLNSLIRAPMAFYDSTPIGRILSRFSYDLSIVDLDIPFALTYAVAPTLATCAILVTLGVVTWQIILVSIPLLFLVVRLQKYYFSTAKELMRINGTTKSSVANHVAESVTGSVTIRAFNDEKRFLSKAFELIDVNSATAFHSFSANEWLIERLEFVGASILAFMALFMVLLPPRSFSSGFIGLALSYALALNTTLVIAIQNQCNIANYIISVERLNQYMNIPSEADLIIESDRPSATWPDVGTIDICNLQIRYRADGPLVLKGITCRFQGRDKIGIVGRTGCGKSTLISSLFRLVEPCGGKILVDGVDISKIGLHDVRSRFGIIPQDPTLFKGTVRFNLDPLSLHSDHEIWEVLGKCQLREVIEEKRAGLNCAVEEEGSNWSMGQRQMFCLGRAVLRKSKILVLDEATASIDNATDLTLQRIIRAEFAECTVITVAHRIPTVMDCTKVLAISEGQLVEFEEPLELMKRETSLFAQLVKEYWSHILQL